MSQDSPPPTEAQLLQALLASRDIACPVCAYNLRSNESKNCPECGAALDLRVGSMDLKLGPWLTALLGLDLPLGFVSIYGVFMLVAMIAFSPIASGGLGLSDLLYVAIPFVVSAAYALVAWRFVRRRRKFWARPRRAQRRSALLYAMIGPGVLLIPLLLLMLLAF